MHVRNVAPSHPDHEPPPRLAPSSSYRTTCPVGAIVTQAVEAPGGDALATPTKPSERSSLPTR